MGLVTAGLVLLLVASLIAPVANLTTGQTGNGSRSGVISGITTNDSTHHDYLACGATGCAIGTCFTASVSGTITGVTADLSRDLNKPNGTMTAEFWSTSGSPSGTCTSLNVLLSTSTNTILASTLPIAPTYATTSFTFSSGSVTSGQSYIIAIKGTWTCCSVWVHIADNNLAVPPNQFSYEDYIFPGGTFASSGDETSCLAPHTCVAYTLSGNIQANQNVTASPGIATLNLYPLLLAGLGIVWAWNVARRREDGI